MADIISQLQVLSQETGCLLDLTALLDLSICPSINILTSRPHKVEEKDDYIYITPTEKKKTKKSLERRCESGSCYEVSDEVCKKSTVALDIEILVLLGLLDRVDLEAYLRIIGTIGEDEELPKCDTVGVDPLLSLNVGKDGSLVDLDVAGEDGLVNLDVGKSKDGKNSLINLDLLGKNGLLNLNIGRRSTDGLLDVDVGGEKDEDEAAIDVDILTHDKKTGQYLTHYQPICKKTFKKEYMDGAHCKHAEDVNHCLAICQAEGALATIQADVKVGDVANIQVCAAIVFTENTDGDNCHYVVAPEDNPCEEDYLEDNDYGYSFVRN